MPENLPVPSPSLEAAQAASAGPGHASLQPSLNGAPPKSAANESEAPRFDLKPWLIRKALQLGALLAVWVVAFLALTLYGLKLPNALGFATVIAVVATFFLRSLLPLPASRALARQTSAPPQPTDSVREVIETVVFVVVLVLLLKSFAAEAFVIPTGSMAQTLWGYQKVVTCPQCGLEFPVNCSSEVDPSEGHPAYVDGCTCPNCRQNISLFPPQGAPREPRPDSVAIPDPGWGSGDRVLVAKFVYDLLGKPPDRLDVVVFKFPGDNKTFPYDSGPVKKHSPMNYIKRLIGEQGETIAIHRGKLYVLPPTDELKHLNDVDKLKDDPNQRLQLWRFEHTHHNDPKTLELFKQGKFQIIRKPPAAVLAMMRLVYDNDHQAKDLTGPEYVRWVSQADGTWSSRDKKAFEIDAPAGAMSWLRYRHVLRNSPDKPQLITDFMGYNTWRGAAHHPPPENWATDLIAECKVQVARPQGSFALELSKGPDRFQARFDLEKGECTLVRLGDKEDQEVLRTEKSRIASRGSYQVRFANVDDRLTVWVNERLIFGDGVEYTARKTLVPQKHNDLDRPVSIGAQGAAVTVSGLRVFRDTYYTACRNSGPAEADVPEFSPQDPETWRHFETLPEPSTYYVQPGHYLCLGDNSPESSDGRSWGLVPQRLLLGRALLVYYPFSRTGRIR